MQNTDIFINPRQSVTFSNSIFHLEEKVTNYLFITLGCPNNEIDNKWLNLCMTCFKLEILYVSVTNIKERYQTSCTLFSH